MRATRRADGALVVVKTPTPELPEPGDLRRLRAEFDVGSRYAAHGGIRYLSYEPLGASAAIVMEDLGAESLDRRVEQRPTLGEWLRVALRLSRSYEALHACGFVHGDVKPANLLALPDGRLVPCDFGNAFPIDSARRFSAVFGTLAYIAPEQTGRTDRVVDHRSDLYSLGVTFFHLLTGRLPFDADDPLSLLHGHLARVPPAVSALRDDVPAVVDAIVTRLLAKDPNDRYQTASGLAADLSRCVDAWNQDGAVAPFEPGAHDPPTTLSLSDRVFGRETQVATLLEVFARLKPGTPEFVLVRGRSGIGKTSVVRELTPSLLQRRALWGAGKFEELRRHVPYSAVFEAVRGVVREALTGAAASVAQWQQRVLDAVGPNARLLYAAVPELAQLLPEQPEVPEVTPTEEQARFTRVSESFVAGLSTPDAPLVLFLDDLQWADDASLRLFESLATVQSATVMVLGAYRDNEVSEGHPLLGVLERVGAVRPITTIELGPLDLPATTALLRQALRRDDGDFDELAARLHVQTGGNPFFLKQLVAVLHREGLLRFDHAGARWTWNLSAITARGFTDNVVALMVEQLRAFAPDEQRVLGLAAAVGARFDLETVAAVSERSVDAVETSLDAALRRRFLRPERDGVFVFAHDRVQEAAYEMIDSSERPAVHLALGRRMREGTGASEQLFDMVGHLNAGRALLADAAERVALVDLNLKAARAARASNAWTAARHHLATARELLGPDPRAKHYDRWLALATAEAQNGYQLDDEAGVEAAVKEVVAGARSELDKAPTLRAWLLMLLGRDRLQEALASAKALAQTLGVALPAQTRTHHVLAGLAASRWRMRGHTAESLCALPVMTDARALVAMEVMVSVMTATFLAEPDLYPVLVFEMLRLTLQHGLALGSAESLASYAMITVAALGDVDEGRRLITAAYAMIERASAAQRRHRVIMADGIFIAPWTRPLGESVALLTDAHRVGMDMGDFEYASISMSTAGFHAMVAGHGLDELEALLEGHLASIRRAKMRHGISDVVRHLQFVRNLRGECPDPLRMRSEGYDEDDDLREQSAAGVKNALSALAWYQGTLALHLRALDRACARADVAFDGRGAHQGTLLQPLIWFLYAIAHLQRGESARSWEALRALRGVAKRAPSTFAHMADLVEAERARVAGRHDEAASAYERAVEGAASSAMWSDAGLAAELAARYWSARGLATVTRALLARARHFYRVWGAAAVVARFDAEFGTVLAAQHDETSASLDGTTATGTRSRQLDLGAALRASNAIALERTLDGVIRGVLAALISDAGAQRAVLLLADEGAQLRAVAESAAETGFAPIGKSLSAYDGVAERIVRFVHRAQTPVVLRDAARVGEFTQDPYVLKRRCRSVVCAPIAQQGRVIGVVFLENNLAAGAFAPARLDMVTMLAAQAAVSIANAELYETLERRVAERTQQLEVRNRFIRQTFGRYLSNEIVDSLLETPEGLELGGARRRATIMLSDLRGFSGIAERIEPEQVVRLINNFLSEMTEVILRHQGTIDEFIGDAILTIFGAPMVRSDDTERAVACALAMQAAMTRVNAWNAAHGLPPVEMGIGVNTGEVVVGNIGSQKRAKYGVVGSNVNLAGRIESYTVGGQVLISEETLRALRSAVRVDAHLVVQPKGMPEPITLYDVSAIEGPYAVSLTRTEERILALAEGVSLTFQTLQGKDVVGEVRRGSLVALGPRSVELVLDAPMAALTDLRLRMEAAPGGDVYAKVTRASTTPDGRCRVSFTSASSELRAWLDAQPLRGT